MNKRKQKRWKGGSAFVDGDGVLCVKREGTLDVAVGVLIGERDVFGPCAGGRWERRRREARLVPLSAGGRNG